MADERAAVLLLDHNEADRRHWADQLKTVSTAYHILEATNAETGLALCNSERIDCVVMELHLPNMSGFQVLLRLNPIVRTLQMPVVVLSHFVLPSIAEAAKKLGAQSYLVKSSCSRDELDSAIQKAIAKVGPIKKTPAC